MFIVQVVLKYNENYYGHSTVMSSAQVWHKKSTECIVLNFCEQCSIARSNIKFYWAYIFFFFYEHHEQYSIIVSITQFLWATQHLWVVITFC